MAEDATEYLASFAQSVSSLVSSSLFFLHFRRRTELLSYLVLCITKMPFIPPVSIARSVSGLTGKEKPISSSASSAAAVAKTKVPREDRGSSVKERLALNFKQLGKKNQPRSHLPAAKGASGAAELQPRRRDRLLLSSQTDSLPASSSGESLSKTQQHKHLSRDVKTEPALSVRSRRQEETSFTLTLTPEAVMLLQRRNSERHQRAAARSAGSGAGVSGSATDSRRRRENVSKRHQTFTSSRVAARNNETELGDIRSILKVSLLNEQHKYDDVEYEQEEDYGVDEHVVLKCTEWLRGLENTPVTAGNRLNKRTSSVKSF